MAMTNIEAGSYEMVANYFGKNKTFQLLPAFSIDHFTLERRQEVPEKEKEVENHSCKYIFLFKELLSLIHLIVCSFSLIIRWTGSISLNWSHGWSCSWSCNTDSILLFQKKLQDNHSEAHTR
ncbi:hypothetical protein ILYODFUR_017828 [Ilyodon furcidens]|uniref:Uncharacterized protein n=1 Tax=Ilyodon furcidens TaxID=33524 RepID=A0ABV0V3Y5_9TELE